jgi:hypothetical protein
VDQIIDAISSEYDVDRDTAQADLTALINDLAGVSLVSRVA